VYACICHAITEDDVRQCAQHGIRTVREARLSCGMRPGCGACVLKVSALLAETVPAGQAQVVAARVSRTVAA
jgi:bacterioferritin-associated ferredoxin